MDSIDLADPGLKGSLHPALRPSNVHAVIKENYRIPAKARELFREVQEPLDEYRDIADKAIVGDVGEISANDGFKFVQSQFESLVGTIHPYGGAFKMTFDEMKWSKINLVEKKMRDLLYKMRKYYEALVLSALQNASGISSVDGSDWTDTSAGDPFSDLENAKGKVYDAHGALPDIAIMNRSQYLNLIKFKEYREYRIMGRSLMETKTVWDDITPNGLQLVIFDDSLNSYIEDNVVWVCKAKDMGVNHVAVPLTTLDREDLDSPLNRNYYVYEYATPSIDKIDAKSICKLYGLDA